MDQRKYLPGEVSEIRLKCILTNMKERQREREGGGTAHNEERRLIAILKYLALNKINVCPRPSKNENSYPCLKLIFPPFLCLF